MNIVVKWTVSRTIRRASGMVWVLLVGTLLAACSGPPLVLPPEADPPPVAEQKLPEHIGIDVFLDASLSMQGYATPEGSSTTPFAQTLEHLDSSRLLLPNSALEFYRFGARLGNNGRPGGQTLPRQPTLELIPNRDFRQAFRRPFYLDPNFTADNFLDQVVKREPAHTLGVIVTDLFQADSDIALLSASLQARLDQGDSIALLSVESPYQGTVFDIGSQHVKLAYNGPRPFFALLYGQPAAVQAYSEALRADLEKDRIACHLLQLTTAAVKQPLSFVHGTPADPVNMDLVTLMAEDDPRVIQLRMRPGAGQGQFPCDFPWEPVSAGMSFDVSRLHVAVTAKRWEGAEWKDDSKAAEGVTMQALPPGMAAAPPNASPAVEATPRTGMRLVFNFDPARLSGPGIYRFDCSLGLEAGDFQLPDWVVNSDMDTSKISEWQRNPALYHGSVLNLRHFVEETWLEVCHHHPPKLGQLYIYLQIPEP